MVLCRSDWSTAAINESIATGTTLAAALEKYRADNGSYPPTLDQLVPKYVPEIRPPRAGNQRWVYEVFQAGSDYTLAFEDDSEYKPTAWYKPGRTKWNVDHK